jgi:uncharacterized membrane protein (Fun14 family)
LVGVLLLLLLLLANTGVICCMFAHMLALLLTHVLRDRAR